jgi:hypothetical protein
MSAASTSSMSISMARSPSKVRASPDASGAVPSSLAQGPVGGTREDFVRELRRSDRSLPIILQTGYANEKPPRELLHSLDIQGTTTRTTVPRSS